MVQFEELRVYQNALIFANLIYKTTESWPKTEIFGLTSQLRRAPVSIALNTAEGSSRSKKDSRHFLDISRGSCYESIAILSIAYMQGYLNDGSHAEFREHATTLAKMLNALKKSLA